MVIRLGQRITNAISSFNILEDKHVGIVGTAVAILVYLGVLAFGWSKKGMAGDFAVGFAAGALTDELLAIGA
jgi:hypothetical protein